MSAYFKDTPTAILPVPTSQKPDAQKAIEPMAASPTSATPMQAAIIAAPTFRAPDPVSRREREVVDLVAKGLSNKEVANLLFVTEKTVKFHLTNIYKKLGLKSRAQLIVAEMNRRAARIEPTGPEF